MIYKAYHFQCLVITIRVELLFPAHLQEASLGSRTDFTLLSLFLSSSFNSLWKRSVLLTENLTNSYIPRIKTH